MSTIVSEVTSEASTTPLVLHEQVEQLIAGLTEVNAEATFSHKADPLYDDTEEVTIKSSEEINLLDLIIANSYKLEVYRLRVKRSGPNAVVTFTCRLKS